MILYFVVRIGIASQILLLHSRWTLIVNGKSPVPVTTIVSLSCSAYKIAVIGSTDINAVIKQIKNLLDKQSKKAMEDSAASICEAENSGKLQ